MSAKDFVVEIDFIDKFLCIVKIKRHSLSSLKEIEKTRKEDLNHNQDFWKLKGKNLII
jgi:hypothetical protein